MSKLAYYASRAKQFLQDKEEGASLVEYGLLLGLIAVVCIAALTVLGQDISSYFSQLAGKLPTVP